MPDSLSLENLQIPDFSGRKFVDVRDDMAAEIQDFKDMYGDRWEDVYFDMLERRDAILHRKFLNHLIYHTGGYQYSGQHTPSMHDFVELEQQYRAICGDQYEIIKSDRVDWDPRIAELLVCAAVQCGNCDELPDILVPEYRRRIGGAQ